VPESDIPRLDTEVKRLDQLRDADQRAVEAALTAAKDAVAAALIASEKAVNKAEEAQLRVNETQNEFRGQLKDQASNLMPRTEAENLVRELRGLIVALSEEIDGLRSRLDVGPPSLGVLQARSDNDAGRRSSGLESRALLFSVLGLVAIGVVFILARLIPV
jgi:predicted  nucleic acid-binding Zn-ribbon protein